MYWEYTELSQTIEEVKNNFKWKEERISKFIEKLNPVEYNEIINELNKFTKEKLNIEWENSDNNNFNILNNE